MRRSRGFARGPMTMMPSDAGYLLERVILCPSSLLSGELFGWKSWGLFGWSNLDLSRFISAYLFSHNTIHSTSRILFTGSAVILYNFFEHLNIVK